jgi:hypothetical protein
MWLGMRRRWDSSANYAIGQSSQPIIVASNKIHSICTMKRSTRDAIFATLMYSALPGKDKAMSPFDDYAVLVL